MQGLSQNIRVSASTNGVSSVTILPPIGGRDILAVGKNYSEHAKEFNASGYDASDKVDMPSHPVIFTKRATSIIAKEEDILLHQGFTQTLDYEGEIGVIIGKGGFQISEADADRHVWGYTIINDVTAREKQRDHKQFYIGMRLLAVSAPASAKFVHREISRYILSHGSNRRTKVGSAQDSQGDDSRQRGETSRGND